MSNFFKMFRSKKNVEKENIISTEEDEGRVKHRNKETYTGGSRREKRVSRMRSIDDSFLKPTAPYHTVTQPRQYKASRSCVGRDEYDKYDKFRHSIDFHNRGNTKYGRRSQIENDRYRDRDLMFSRNICDPGLLDSDDSLDSVGRFGENNEDAVQALETKLDTLLYRLRREEERKNAYKQKLLSERIVRQHVESKFVEDIQRLTQLVETLKNEQKSYRNRINDLEKQLKQTGPKLMADSFKGSSLFCSPPSTSNGQPPMLAMTDLACSATSGSTVPLPSTLRCSTLNEGSVDEVKNFRTNEVTSSVETERHTLSGSSFSTRECEGSTTLEETFLAIDRATAAASIVSRRVITDKAATAVIRRSSSDTKLGQREMMLKSTDI